MSCSGTIRRVSSLVKKVHLDKLIQVINSCGVSFSVWEKRNADGKRSGTWDWTSLVGDDRKTVLKVLPSKLEPFIQQDTARTVVKLWKVLNLIDISNMKDLNTVAEII